MVKAAINGRIFTLTWAEFESFMLHKLFSTSVEILEAA